MKTETMVYVVPSWALSYLINGDLSGYSDEEEQAVTTFEVNCINESEKTGASHFHFATIEDYQEHFAPCNDVTGNVGGEVEQIEMVMFFREEGEQ